MAMKAIFFPLSLKSTQEKDIRKAKEIAKRVEVDEL